MSRYIKKEDAENIILGSCDESALWKLRHIPPADVVEVVRCKDCVKRHDGCPMQVWCGTGDADYCSRGESKQDD